MVIPGGLSGSAGLLGQSGLGNVYAQGRSESQMMQNRMIYEMERVEEIGKRPPRKPKNIREELQQKVTKWLEPVRLT